ncbi:hypothetical protein FB446DRAFT_760202 [Lentinula raphanica]|nr:hypothetical protein FB446DRAFT_760202 [Lentinula raphanica]
MFSTFRPAAYRPRSGFFDAKAYGITVLLFLGLVSLACASPIPRSALTLSVPSVSAPGTMPVEEPSGSPGAAGARSPSPRPVTPGIIVTPQSGSEDESLARTNWQQLNTPTPEPPLERKFRLVYRKGRRKSVSNSKVIKFLEMGGIRHTDPEGTPTLNRGYIRFDLVDVLPGEEVVVLSGRVRSKGRYITGLLWDAKDRRKIYLNIEGSKVKVNKMSEWSAT